MKKAPRIMVLHLLLLLFSNPVFGVNYRQTYDEALTLEVGQCTYMDIWVNDLPEPLITAGFFLTWNPLLSSVNIEVYDGTNGPDGPWDPGSTFMLPDASGPGTYMLAVLNLALAPLGTGGDIIIASAEICPTAAGDNNISIATIPEFDTVVGWPSQYCYDSEITPNIVTVHQILAPCRCRIAGPQIIQADGARPVTAQYTASSVNPLNCENQTNYVWSDSCTHGGIDQNGLFTVPPFTSFESCELCVTDTANTDINTGALVHCCLPVSIRGG